MSFLGRILMAVLLLQLSYFKMSNFLTLGYMAETKRSAETEFSFVLACLLGTTARGILRPVWQKSGPHKKGPHRPWNVRQRSLYHSQVVDGSACVDTALCE